MKIIVVVVGITLFNFSQANNFVKNIVIWKALPEFYASLGTFETSGSKFLSMSRTERHELCSTTAAASIFRSTIHEIYHNASSDDESSDNESSDNEILQSNIEVISSWAKDTDVALQVQRKSVSVENMSTTEIRILVCRLDNGRTFYLGEGRNRHSYFLYKNADNDVLELYAAVETFLHFRNVPAPFTEPTDTHFLRREERLCKAPMPDIMNICASVLRSLETTVVKSYLLDASFNADDNSNCHERLLETEIVKVVTCYLTSLSDEGPETEFKYYITADRNNDNSIFLLGPSDPETRDDTILIILQHLTYVG